MARKSGKRYLVYEYRSQAPMSVFLFLYTHKTKVMPINLIRA
jgi:hypothetical protein